MTEKVPEIVQILAGERKGSTKDWKWAFPRSAASIPAETPTLHQQLIDTIQALLKKHEAHHNSVEHAAARALLRKIRGEA